MKITYLCLLVMVVSKISYAIITPAIIDNWLQPFNNAIERLERSDVQYPSVSKINFRERAKKAWDDLSEKRRSWIDLLDPDQNVMQLAGPRRSFGKKSYISKVFTTKPGTLVIEMRKYPEIIIKIDNRPDDFLGQNNRNYFAAYEKSNQVQEQFLFRNLYLPLEIGAEMDTLRGVISERIPLFSVAEIDNRILLHWLIERSENNNELKNKLKLMYKQMIHYVCKVNFDDINYTNVPFAIDGRLAPFDTDSQTAVTGVGRFLRLFFGYKILSLDEVTTAVNDSCVAPHIPSMASLEDIYNDHAQEDEFFINNREFIDGAINFMYDKMFNFRDRFNFSTFIHDENRIYTKYIDETISEKLGQARGQWTIFGQRCWHVGDFVYETALKINNKYDEIAVNQAEEIVRTMLNGKGKEYKAVYSKEPIDYRLGNLRDLRSFICF